MKGDALVAFHRIEQLAHRHEISLISFYGSSDELEYISSLEEACSSVSLVRLPVWRGVANVVLRAPVSRTPLQVLYYRSGSLADSVRELAGLRRFDVVHAFMLRMAPYARLVDAPAILEAIDSMQLRMERNVHVERPPRRWLYREELRRLAPYESCVGARFEEVVVSSREDARRFPRASVHVVPNGVDTETFSPAPGLEESATIVFSGTMSYPPNVRAASWFAEECFERIRAHVPGASLLIAGKAPVRQVRQLGEREGISVTGFVDSMPEMLRRARVAVAPMLSGAGIQNKVLEAMACGLPVVATTFGAAAIDAAPGRDLIVADGADAFADAVVGLLLDSARARQVGANARAVVLERHGWDRSAAAIEGLYESLPAAPRMLDP